LTIDQVQQIARQHYPPYIARLDRWIAHYQNRLAYERALLAAFKHAGTTSTRRCW
jgi:hypothetical protein